MSKRFEQPINEYLFSKIEKPIREKIDIIILLLETVNLLLVGNTVQVTNQKGKIIIYIDKMSRVIYELENKIFSINFPFFCEKRNEEYIIRSNDKILTPKIISDLMSIALEIKNNKDIDSILERIIDTENIYEIIKKLFISEYGYIRYDYDPEHFIENIHPLNHLDVNCSNNNQYKLGLERNINVEKFIDILDLNTDCYFIKES